VSTPKTETVAAKPPATKSAQIEKIATANAPVIRHKVKTGETLYSIATYYKTTVAALKRDNRNIAILRPGMILIVQQAR
jgi:LysM repeat protein